MQQRYGNAQVWGIKWQMSGAKCDAGMSVQVNGLRKEIVHLLLRKIEEPSFDLSASKVVEAVLKLLVHDGF